MQEQVCFDTDKNGRKFAMRNTAPYGWRWSRMSLTEAEAMVATGRATVEMSPRALRKKYGWS